MLTKVSLKSAFYLCVVGVFTLFSCSDKRSGDPRVLVFSKTSGFHHQSIDAGNAALRKLAQEKTTRSAGPPSSSLPACSSRSARAAPRVEAQ